LKYLTLWFNSSSKGPIFTRLSGGFIILTVFQFFFIKLVNFIIFL
jgi:hypothetical protein